MRVLPGFAAAIFAVAALPAAFTALPAAGQVYATPTPVPRATDAATLHQQAIRRAVHERFTLGLDALSHAGWSSAADEFEAVVALHPAEPQGSTAHYDLALADAHLKRYTQAAQELRAAIALDDGFLAAYANLVAVELDRGDLSAARTAADRFVAHAPDAARALYSRGIVALAAGDAATARADFQKLLENDPSYAIAHYDLGLAQVKIGDYPAAEREFTSALQLAPAYARARFSLGTVLLREGRRDDARAAFARAAVDAVDPTLRTLAVAMRDAVSHE